MTEKQRIAQDESRFARECMLHPNGYQGVVARKPLGSVSAPMSAAPDRHTQMVEQHCEDCDGSGGDPGALNPWEAEACPTCNGVGTRLVERNYLAEAFRIAAGESLQPPEPEHVKAVVEHCRKLASAALTLPEVA
jgi:hypothetical protein